MTDDLTKPASSVKKTTRRKTAAEKPMPTPVLAPEVAAPGDAEAAQPVAPAKKKATRKSAVASKVSPEERHHLIEVAAYFIAERRGFHGISSHEDWVQAEMEIDAMIAAGLFLA
jgi:hypothetical protein